MDHTFNPRPAPALPAPLSGAVPTHTVPVRRKRRHPARRARRIAGAASVASLMVMTGCMANSASRSVTVDSTAAVADTTSAAVDAGTATTAVDAGTATTAATTTAATTAATTTVKTTVAAAKTTTTAVTKSHGS